MSTQLKTILCPVDFTKCSENALRYTLHLADEYEAEIHLLHVLMPATEAVLEVPGSIPVVNRKLEEDTREALTHMVDRVLTQVGEQLKHIPVINSHVEIGTPGFLINDAATDYKVDLIVMGTRREEERPWYMGSVARDTLHHPAKPLLIVPQETPYAKIERVAFASDLRRADIAHLLEIDRILRPFRPDIRCVHVDTGRTSDLPFEKLASLCEEQLPGINVTFHELVEEDTTEALEAFNLVYHVDLQVMTRPHRSFFGDLFHRSQVKRTAKYTHVPLLVLGE